MLCSSDSAQVRAHRLSYLLQAQQFPLQPKWGRLTVVGTEGGTKYSKKTILSHCTRVSRALPLIEPYHNEILANSHQIPCRQAQAWLRTSLLHNQPNPTLPSLRPYLTIRSPAEAVKLTRGKQNKSSAPRKAMPVDPVCSEGTQLFCLREAQLTRYLSAQGIQVCCAKMPFPPQLQAAAQSPLLSPDVLACSAANSTCLSKLPTPPPGETVAGGELRGFLQRICSFIKGIGTCAQLWKLPAKITDGVTAAVELEQFLALAPSF